MHFGGFHLVPPGSSNSYNITAPDATNNSTKAPPPLGVEGQSTEISPDLATDLFPHFVDHEKRKTLWHKDILGRFPQNITMKWNPENICMIQTLTVETGPSMIYLKAENKLHICKSVNVRKTPILGPTIWHHFNSFSWINISRKKLNFIQKFEFFALSNFRNG